jgi:hypothetical protein
MLKVGLVNDAKNDTTLWAMSAMFQFRGMVHK